MEKLAISEGRIKRTFSILYVFSINIHIGRVFLGFTMRKYTLYFHIFRHSRDENLFRLFFARILYFFMTPSGLASRRLSIIFAVEIFEHSFYEHRGTEFFYLSYGLKTGENTEPFFQSEGMKRRGGENTEDFQLKTKKLINLKNRPTKKIN